MFNRRKGWGKLVALCLMLALLVGPGGLMMPGAADATSSLDEIKTDYITVNSDLVAPTAAFTADTTSGTAPLAVSFTDESTGTAPLTYAWDFDNDGTVDSTDQNPSYEYSVAGIYSVKLTVTNTAGSDDEIKTDFITAAEAPAIDVLYDGTVTLTPDETFDVTPSNSSTAYTVSKTTPLGALQAAADAGSFTYNVTDKRWSYDGVLLLDDIGTYLRDKTNGVYWYAYVNDVYKDGYMNISQAL